MRRAPDFWWSKSPSFLACLLRPLSLLYGIVFSWRYAKGLKTTIRAPVPVISIGNIVMGGAGKTPVTLALSSLLHAEGYKPVVLTRGYGGTASGPLWVHPEKSDFSDVGDEALLLARQFPTVVARCRAQGLSLLEPTDKTVLLLDDGHQHTSLYKDISFVVIDENQGQGNGELFPAGPLRESLKTGLGRADAVVWIGNNPSDFSLPVFKAYLSPTCSLRAGERVLGFAGLGYPLKFYKTLQELQFDVVDFCSFPDHFPYKERDLEALLERAQWQKAVLITTEKDQLRLPQAFQEKVFCVKVRVVWENPQDTWDFIRKKLCVF